MVLEDLRAERSPGSFLGEADDRIHRKLAPASVGGATIRIANRVERRDLDADFGRELGREAEVLLRECEPEPRPPVSSEDGRREQLVEQSALRRSLAESGAKQIEGSSLRQG